jgi:thioredoxin-related protein
MKQLLIVSTLVLTVFFSAFSQGISFQHSWTDAMAQAAKEKKLVFMDAYTTWCGPCKLLDRNVFSTKEVGDYFNANFVSLKMDMEKGEGIQLAQKYGVRAYPTLLFLDAMGNVVHRTAGYRDVEQFLELGKTALNPATRLGALEARYKQGARDPEFLLTLATAKYDAMDPDYAAVASEYLNAVPDWNNELTMQFIYMMVSDVNSRMFDHLREQRTAYENLFGKQEVAARIEQVIYSSVYALGEQPDLAKVDEIFAKAYPEKAGQLSAYFRLRYYADQEDYTSYAKAAIAYFKKYPSADAMELNNEAWTFYEAVDDKKLLKEALKWAKKSVKLEPAYYNSDTLASLYFKLGNKGAAKKAAEKAIALAKASGEDPSGTEELLERIKSM